MEFIYLFIYLFILMILMREGDTPEGASPKGLGWPLHREKKKNFKLIYKWRVLDCLILLLKFRLYFCKNNQFVFLYKIENFS